MANYQTLKEHDMRNLLMVLKKPKKCGGFLFLLKLIAPNGGNWRSKSLALLLMFSTTLDGFYFANCVLAAVFFSLIDYQHFRK